MDLFVVIGLSALTILLIMRHTKMLRITKLLDKYQDWYTYDQSASLHGNIKMAEQAMEVLKMCQARKPDRVLYADVHRLYELGFTYDIDISLGANITRLHAIIAVLKS